MSAHDPLKPKSAFEFEAPEDSAGFLLWQTTITWQRLIRNALEPYGITHAQFVVMAVALWFEEHHQEPTQIAIARLSKLDAMTVSKSLKSLIAQGYVSRTESKKDTRAKWVRLTPKGKTLISKLVPLVEGIDDQFFGVVEHESQNQLIHILNTLVAQFP